MDNRRLLIAAFISMAFVIVWTFLFPPAKPPAKLPPAQAVPAAVESPASAASPAASSPGIPPAVARAAESPVSPPPAPVAAEREETVTLEANDVRAAISNRGAQLVSLQVRESANRATTLDLVRKREQAPYPFGLIAADASAHPLDGALFAVDRGADGRSATFRYSGLEGTAEKRFAFDLQGLLDVTITLPGQKGWGVVVGPGLRNLSTSELKSRFEQRGAVYKTEEVQVVDPQRTFEATHVAGGSLHWIGLEDTYFLGVVIPQKGLQQATIEPFLVTGADTPAVRYVPMPKKDDLTSDQKDLPRELRVVLRPEGDTLALRSYWGNKSYERLSALPYGLEETISWGSLRILVRPLLAGIHWLHDHVVANYGWAIVLMTVLIKLVLLPLTHHSMKSMKKMQELTPKQQAIRDRYRTKLKDKQGKPNLEMQRKMNDEVMALYREHGVNPAGGCLPMLLQMPILFAFYRLLGTAAELRGAPWILWIRDLSGADPYLVLPIVMGLTQFLQVRLSPQTGDPMQRRMFMLMPLFMTFLFLKFPSGLVLYWLTNNVLTIAQQWGYNRQQRTA